MPRSLCLRTQSIKCGEYILYVFLTIVHLQGFANEKCQRSEWDWLTSRQTTPATLNVVYKWQPPTATVIYAVNFQWWILSQQQSLWQSAATWEGTSQLWGRIPGESTPIITSEGSSQDERWHIFNKPQVHLLAKTRVIFPWHLLLLMNLA